MKFTVTKYTEIPFEAETISEALRLSAAWIDEHPNRVVHRIVPEVEDKTVFILVRSEEGSGEEIVDKEFSISFK